VLSFFWLALLFPGFLSAICLVPVCKFVTIGIFKDEQGGIMPRIVLGFIAFGLWVCALVCLLISVGYGEDTAEINLTDSNIGYGSEEISVGLDEINDVLNRCLEFLETEYDTPHDSMIRMSDLVYIVPPSLYERLKRSDKAEIERIKERMAKRERERDLVIDIQKLIEKLEIIRGER